MATTSSSPSTPVLGLDGLHPSASNGSSNGATTTATNGTSAAPLPSVDPAVFRSYLLALLPPVLGASIEDLEGTLFDDEFDERVVKYASEGGGSVIYVAKTRHDAEDDGPPTYSYSLTPQLTYSPTSAMTLALIKRAPVLDTLAPLASQLHMINLFGGEETPYEGLHAVVSYAVKPWFDAFVGTRAGAAASASGAGGKDEGKMGIPMTKKKFAELELSLLHLQQNVEIPETHLIIHPVIQRAVAQAQQQGLRPNINNIPPQLLTDSTFLNTLQGHVNMWIKSIQAVTKLTRDVSSGTASQEINFWLSLERALEAIEAQLRSDEVVMVMDALRNAKRYLATVSFIVDTGLKEATDQVHKYNQLMKDFPLNELLSATDLDKIQESLYLIFGHINRKLRLSPYPIRRALPLVEAISRDFNDQLLRVLTSHRLPYIPYDSFDRLLASAQAIFRTWDELMKEFTNVAREVTRRRSEKFIPIKVVGAHGKLAERCRYLRDWRKQHEQLAVMTGPTKGLGGPMGIGSGAVKGEVGPNGTVPTTGTDGGGMDMEEEVREAYEIVKSIDVLDVSTEGTEIWVTAESAYNERVSRVENQIIARLRDRLGTARNANEMFRVFSKFNALFVRQKIRGAIREYQTQLIDSVKEDIARLHDKFKTQYRFSEAYHMSQMRDLPPIAGAIIWAREIERQLSTYMRRVEDVLGKDWVLYAEGQKLQTESSSFRRKLDTKPLYEAWLHDINRRDMGINGRLFEIVRLRGGGYQLAVNFDAHIITLFKEVRNLLWLNYQVPHAISNMAKDAKRVYPHAVSLMETVRTYSQTLDLIEKNPAIEMLVAEFRNEAQRMISRGMTVRWDFFVNAFDTSRYLPAAGLEGRENRNLAYVREFAAVVSILQDKTNALIDSYREINHVVEELSTCAFTAQAFGDLIARVQSSIDRLNLEGYANLEHWVARLDERIEGTLLQRLTAIIQLWCAEFERADDDDSHARHNTIASRDRDATISRRGGRGDKKLQQMLLLKGDSDKTAEGTLTLKPIIHEVRIQDQVIFLDPPIEHARETWIKQLHEWLAVVCGVRRIQSSRYEIGLQMRGLGATELTYTSLLTRFTDDTLSRPFILIENKLAQVRTYVAKWLQFQSLWDLESESVFQRLGDSLAAWQQLLAEIKRTRATFDNAESEKSFGVLVVDYEQVQARVNAKYDSWQREILQRFGVKLGAAMKDVHASIVKARNDLEHHSIEGMIGGAR